MGTAAGAMVLIVASVLVLVGLALIAMGVRGKRINDRPTCRGCGFDLSGLGDLKATLGADGSVSGTVCPECGSQVWKPGSVRLGQRSRARLWGLASTRGVIGVVLVVLGLAGIGGQVAQRVSKKTWYASLPRWVLIEMADGWIGKADQEVMEEVVNRLPRLVSGPGVSGGGGSSGAVMAPDSWTKEQIGVLAGRAAKGIERTASEPIITSWLRVYQEATGTPGLTTEEQTGAVASAVMNTSIKARSMVRRGETLYVEFQPSSRLKQQNPMGVVWVSQRVSMRIKQADGTWGEAAPMRFSRQLKMQGMLMSLSPSGEDGTTHFKGVDVEPGEYEMKVEGEYSATILNSPGLPLGGSYQAQEQMLRAFPTRKVEWAGRVRVLASDVPAVELDTRPEEVRAFARGVKVALLRWKQAPASGGEKGEKKGGAEAGGEAIGWDLRLVIEGHGQVLPNRTRIRVQGKSERGEAVGEAWAMSLNGWSTDGSKVSAMAVPSWEWERGESMVKTGYRPDAPQVDIVIEPSLESLEQSMVTHTVGVRMRFSNVRVVDEEGSLNTFGVGLDMLSKGKYKAAAATLDVDKDVESVTPSQLLQALEEDRRARKRANQNR